MSSPATTCWTMIKSAAAGDDVQRAEFARIYLQPVRAYFIARWSVTTFSQRIDDAVQEVCVECLKEQGVLVRAVENECQSFRSYLFGVVRNVALRVEERSIDRKRRHESVDGLEQLASDDAQLSKVFDREWAGCIMRQAAQRQAAEAQELGEAAVQRVELLRLRFEEALPIREIAARWGCDATRLHREYAKARIEFASALKSVIQIHHPGDAKEIESESARLLEMLS